MFLDKKIRRAIQLTRDRRLRAQGRDPEQEALEARVRNRGKGEWKEELPTMEELLEEEDRLQLEKGDLPALILSAFLTIVPVCVLVILVICLVAYLFFSVG